MTIDINWGGPGYGEYNGFGSSAPVGAGAGTGAGTGSGAGAGAGTGTGTGAGTGTGTGTGSGAPSGAGGSAGQGSPTGPGSGAGPGSSSGTGTSGSGSPTGQGGSDPNIATIRASHEALQRLGGLDKVQGAVERYNRMHDTSAEIATQLGYTPESFEAAFAESPAEIYTHLLNEFEVAQRASGRGDGTRGEVNQVLQDHLNRQLQPIRQHIIRQQAREANDRVDSEFGRLFGEQTLFKGKQVPAEVRDFVYNHFTDLVKWDDNVQNAVLQGDVSKLQPLFDKAVANLVAFSNNWAKWTTGSAGTGAGTGTGTGANAGAGTGTGEGGTGAGNGNGARNPFSLDDIIEGNENATRALPSMRGFRT
jgi:hypothetical protein